MKYLKQCSFWLVAVLFAVSGAFAQVQAPPIVYQGEVHKDGQPLDGEYGMEIEIYETSSGGSPVETLAGPVNVDRGLFQIEFNLDPSIFTGNAMWVEITVIDTDDGTTHTLTPRQPMGAAPYAMNALSGGDPAETTESPWEVVTNGIRYTDGRVAIGTNSAAAQLDVRGSGSDRPLMVLSGSDVLLHTYPNNSLTVGAAAPGPNNGLRVVGESQFDERVGIGVDDPNMALHVRSDAAHRAIILQSSAGSDGWGIGTGASSGNFNFYRTSNAQSSDWGGTLRARIDSDTGEYSTSSDQRLKTDIEPVTGILDDVLALEASSYRFEDDQRGDSRTVGFMAQQVRSHFPELVVEDEESEYLGLHYSQFSVLAIQAIREQQDLIESQEQKIERLRERLEQVEADTADRLAQIEAVLLGDAEMAERSQ